MGYINGKEGCVSRVPFHLISFPCAFWKMWLSIVLYLDFVCYCYLRDGLLYFVILAFCASSLLCSKIVHRQR